ncbi:TOBE domain-containing protein, partial [Streptomyces sp. NPDC059597]|uniref:TOBE domain-containing protein n=1 Tax=Streptomyces sp. NPDC059597 TaxID=3346879 RepID=UPI0036CBD0CE
VAPLPGFPNFLAPPPPPAGPPPTPWGKLPVPEGSPQGGRELLVRPAGVRLVAEDTGLPCTVAARTFKGTHVALRLRPHDGGPLLEAACAPADAPETGAETGVVFDASDVVVLG